MRTPTPRSNRGGTLPAWLTYALTLAFMLSGIAVVIFAYLSFRVMANRPLNPLEESVAQVANVSLEFEQVGPAAVPTIPPGVPTPTLIPTNEPWQGGERVNILVMGIDRRPGEPFVSRTDSMMVISIDPENDTASVLSVPRDLYVLIPGHGRDRINTAFVYGSRGNNPAGGAALAMQTVEYNLGISLQHYVLVDFSAVINGVNAIGGIDVNVPFTINDPTFPDMGYGFDPLYIPAGLQYMDGELALKYARTRHVDSDFGRAQRQQQVLLAVRQKILSLGVPYMLSQAPTLFAQLDQGIRTDLTLEQILQLGRAASNIPEDNIRSAVLDTNYVRSFTTEQGAQVLFLINEQAAALIQELFYQ